MKIKILVALTAACLVLSSLPVVAQTTDAEKELQGLVAKVQVKLKEGKNTEADLAPELKEFDALLAKHQGEKTDDVAQILVMEAMLYSQVLKNEAKGEELLNRLKRDFPRFQASGHVKKAGRGGEGEGQPQGGSEVPRFR